MKNLKVRLSTPSVNNLELSKIKKIFRTACSETRINEQSFGRAIFIFNSIFTVVLSILFFQAEVQY